MKPGYRYMDHTADVGLEVFAPNLSSLFEHAAMGMMSFICPSQSIEIHETLKITLHEELQDRLLLNWLREILFLVYSRNWIFKSFQVEINPVLKSDVNGYLLNAYLHGETFNPSRHEICKEIKAVTRHLFSLKQREDGWESQILFDV